MANRFLSNIRINDAYTFPASDGSNGQVIVTDGAGNLAFANPSTSSSASIIYRDNFTGDGSTVAFTLQNSLSDEDQTFIYIDGVYQEKGTYSLSTNTITFTTAPDTGHSIEVISVSGINVGPTTIYQDNFTGDGTTTDFTLAQVVDNEVKTMIYFNGVYQFKGTYSLNGTALSFDTAPANGVNIEVISIASAAAADYNQKVLFYGKATQAISKGDAIMLGGQEGDHFLLSKATQTAIAANHEYFLGLASQDLVQGEFGYVTEFGKITELDTSGYTAGDILWFDAGGSTAGALTTTEPAPPLVKIQVAAVIRSHQNEGVLFIRPSWYHELGELHDVNVTSVVDKDMLVWDNVNGYWENTKALGDITATSLAVDTDTLYVDAVNNRVGIGTSSPASRTHIVNSSLTGFQSRTQASLTLESSDNTELYFATSNSGLGQLRFGDTSSNYKAALNFDHSDDAFKFIINTGEKVRITSSGNVGIGNVGSNAKLEVSASSGEVFRADASGGAYRIVANQSGVNLNGNVGIGTGTPVTKLDVTGDIHSTVGLRIGSATNGTTGQFLTDGTNTYLDYNGFLSVRRSASSSEVLRINSSGQVLINTQTNQFGEKLTVSGFTANVSGSVVALTGSDGTASIFGSYTNHPIVFRTNNTERMRITSAGDLGIGTTTINATYLPKLEITSTASDGTGGLLIGSYLPTLTFHDYSGGATIGQIQQDGTGLVFKNNGSERMRITGDGKVLINQTSSLTGQALQVNGFIDQTATTSAFRLYNGSTFIGGIGNGQWAYTTTYLNDYAVYATNDLLFSSGGGGPDMILNASGDVGIGTTSPAHKLQVIGDGQFGESATVSEDSRVRIRTSSDGFIGMVRTGVRTWAHKIDAGGHYYIRNADASYNTLTLTDTNRVGIGITEPSGMLHVADQASTVTLMLGRATGMATIKSDSTADGHLIIDSGTNGTAVFLQNYTSGNVYLATGGGKVGIGTTTPSEKLDVNGNVNVGSGIVLLGQNRIDGSSDNLKISADHSSVSGSSTIEFLVDGSEKMRITSAGNVGIGNASPQYKLDVNGGIRTGDSVINWYQSTLPDNVAYVHLKTSLWAGGGSQGNTDYTMSLFSAKAYFYSPSAILEGNVGFHNWSNSIYNTVITGNIWSSPYASSDGYVVLVVATSGRTYGGISIDWHQSYQYPFRTAVVTATSGTSSSTGAF